MRSKLVYLIAGIIISSSVFVGAGLLYAQNSTPGPVTFNGSIYPRWEYAWVQPVLPKSTGTPFDTSVPLISVTMNNLPLSFQGDITQLFDQLGADGWELVDSVGGYFVFKRPLAS